jgi:integrase
MTRYPRLGKGRRWTVVELRAIPSDWRGDTLADGDGLSGEVRVTADGSIAVRWKYAFRWDGKVCWYQAGTWPATSLEDVRSRRDEARRLVAEGVNPTVHRQAKRVEAQRQAEAVLREEAERKAQDATVNDLFDEWLKDGVNRSDGNAELRRCFEKDVLPRVGTMPIRLVTESDLLDVLRGQVSRGVNRTAVLTCKNIQQMFRWAEKRQPWRRLLAEGNPASLVKIKRVVAKGYDIRNIRPRWLRPRELQQLAGVFTEMEATYDSTEVGHKYDVARPFKKTSQLAAWICLSTMSRIGETLRAEWRHVDFEARTWFIPRENVKGEDSAKRDLTVHLSDFSLRQFRALHSETGHTKWLFPAKASTDTHVDVKTVSKQVGDRQVRFKQRTKRLAGRREDNSLVLADGENGEWTLHDLRRTGATMLQQLGTPAHVIDLCQNHVIGTQVQRAYQQHNYAEEVKDAWIRLGSRLDALMLNAQDERLKAGKAALHRHLLPATKCLDLKAEALAT